MPNQFQLKIPALLVIFITMSKPKSMTKLLQEALAKADSVRAVAKATGLKHPSLIRFMRGDQSLRLDLADKLADYFGIECRKGR